jgi:hypothetical protein
MKLPEVTWSRHECFYEPEFCRGSLLWLVFDIPYFDACGIFPPFHIANQIFLSGGSPGGMGPGATWESFSISEEQYDALAYAVINTPKSEIKPHARYASLPLTTDHSFDHIQNRLEWLSAVCEMHRRAWHEKLRNAGLMK